MGVMRGKRGFELPFSWLFAVIAGGVILFIAIYAAVNIIDSSKAVGYSETAKSLTILFDPLESGIASTRGDVIRFNRESRTNYGCYTTSTKSPVFGRQTISFSEQSGLGKEWQEVGAEISVYNKYLFADNIEQGKNLYLFSKPFFMGFKVSDLIILSSENFCFVSPPDFINDDLSVLAFDNINVSNTIANCETNSKKVCFGLSDSRCNITVFDRGDWFKTGQVQKNGDSIYYVGNLIYAAIFSSPEIYECNIKRLGEKMAELGWVYKDKTEVVGAKGCDSIIGNDLELLSEKASDIQNSLDLFDAEQIAEQMDEKNKEALCRIYSGEDY